MILCSEENGDGERAEPDHDDDDDDQGDRDDDVNIRRAVWLKSYLDPEGGKKQRLLSSSFFPDDLHWRFFWTLTKKVNSFTGYLDFKNSDN